MEVLEWNYESIRDGIMEVWGNGSMNVSDKIE